MALERIPYLCHKTIVSETENFSNPVVAARFSEAIRRFDAENAKDPNRVVIDGREQPYELAYAGWLTEWVMRLQPDAAEELRLAARGQHLRRWEIPRDTYPRNRQGYLQWREKLKRLHAQMSGDILQDLGYPEATVTRVRDLILKKNIATDPDGRTLEDALCLVFLERQLDALSAKTDVETLVGALRKAWNKMSPEGQKAASELIFKPEHKALLARALAPI